MSLLPEVLEPTADTAATKSDDPVGSWNSSEHTGLIAGEKDAVIDLNRLMIDFFAEPLSRKSGKSGFNPK